MFEAFNVRLQKMPVYDSMYSSGVYGPTSDVQVQRLSVAPISIRAVEATERKRVVCIVNKQSLSVTERKRKEVLPRATAPSVTDNESY